MYDRSHFSCLIYSNLAIRQKKLERMWIKAIATGHLIKVYSYNAQLEIDIHI